MQLIAPLPLITTVSYDAGCQSQVGPTIIFSTFTRVDGIEVALVNVPYGSGGESMRPLGLAALGAYLTSNGVSSRGFDFSDSLTPPEELVKRFDIDQYPVVGLSFYNTNSALAFRMARAIKSRNPMCVVVAGGPHASATGERLIAAHPEIDIVVKNEGEDTLLELVGAIRTRRPMNEIAGIACHRSGYRLVTSERGRIDDLDTLPTPVFDFVREDGTEKKLYFFDRAARKAKPAAVLVTSRSCPFRCSFCAIILIGRKWRKTSPTKVIDDLVKLERHQGERFEHVYFLDANFFVDPRRTVEVARELHRFRDTLTFSFSTRVNQLIRGKPFLGELVALGLRAVELGIESGSDAALRRFTKDTTTEQNAEAIRLLTEHDLQLFLDFIMFDPEASLEDLALNLKFLEANSLDSYVPWDHIISHMTPYLGTSIRKHYEEVFGRHFEEDELPDPSGLFVDSKVQRVFAEISRIKPFLPRMAKALWATEEKLGGEWCRETARVHLNAAMLRRVPFVTLRNLVKQAWFDQPVDFDQAVPTFGDDEGQRHRLEEFLDYALH